MLETVWAKDLQWSAACPHCAVSTGSTTATCECRKSAVKFSRSRLRERISGMDIVFGIATAGVWLVIALATRATATVDQMACPCGKPHAFVRCQGCAGEIHASALPLRVAGEKTDAVSISLARGAGVAQ
jgi:hypothetical protein